MKSNQNNSERGSAIIIVVGTVAVLTVMLLHLTVASGIAAREARVSAARAHLRYDAESAANQAFWLYLSDRKKHPSRGIQTSQLLDDAELVEGERWQADGVSHTLDTGFFNASVALYDADQGIALDVPNPAQSIEQLLLENFTVEDDETSDMLAVLRDQIGDYVDGGDDFRRLNGMEADEYEALGWPHLPRNGPFQFREEILWIEAMRDVLAFFGTTSAAGVVNTFRLIPPKGFAFPRSSKPSFFGASPLLVSSKLGVTEEELDEIFAARQKWTRGNPDALNNLPDDLANLIRGTFSFTESGIVTITATARLPNGEVIRTVRLTRDSRTIPPANQDNPAWINWALTVDPSPGQ